MSHSGHRRADFCVCECVCVCIKAYYVISYSSLKKADELSLKGLYYFLKSLYLKLVVCQLF